jgi:hypothetical protein
MPFIHQSTNPQISIADDWTVLHQGNPLDGDCIAVNWHIVLKLKQNGINISGTGTSVCLQGPDDIKGKRFEYLVLGSFVNSILDLTIKEKGNLSRSRSVFMFQMIGDGTEFTGYRTFFGRNKNQIRVIEFKLNRKGALAGCGTA